MKMSDEPSNHPSILKVEMPERHTCYMELEMMEESQRVIIVLVSLAVHLTGTALLCGRRFHCIHSRMSFSFSHLHLGYNMLIKSAEELKPRTNL